MFSKRTAWSRSANDLHAARAKTQEPIVDLTVSNPARAGLSFSPDRLAAALAEGARSGYAPNPLGLTEARAAVSAYYAARQVEVNADSIVLTASTSEAYSFLFHLLADPGDRILAPAPSYPLLNYLAGLADVSLENYSLRYDGAWYLDAPSLSESLARGARAVIDVSPNNPTGSCLGLEERAWLTESARAHGAAVIADEVFLDYLDDPHDFHARTWAKESDCLTFVLGGLSKAAGLPGLKLAWIAIQGPRTQTEEARARLELVADTYLSVNMPTQAALSMLLPEAEVFQQQVRARLRHNVNTLSTLTAGTALSVRRREGGWYAILELPRLMDDEAWAVTLLLRQGILLHPGYLYDLDDEACLVLSLLPEPETFRDALARVLAEVGFVSRG